jgi:hypothetical protein
VQGSLESAGDLNGDKLPDVLDLRQMVQGSTRLLGITARTGRSGRRLWQRTVSLSVNGFAIAQPERVGPRDKPGVLVVTSQQTAATSGGFGVSLRLREYAGKAGHLLWTTTLNGSIDSGGQFVDVPQLVGLLPVRGQAPDLGFGRRDHYRRGRRGGERVVLATRRPPGVDRPYGGDLPDPGRERGRQR